MTNRMRTWTLNSKRNSNNSNSVSQVKQSTRVPIVIIASFRSTEPVIVYFKPWAIPLAISDGGANVLGDDGPGRRGRHPDQLAVQLPPHVQHVRHGPPDDQQYAGRAHKVRKSRMFEQVFVSSKIKQIYIITFMRRYWVQICLKVNWLWCYFFNLIQGEVRRICWSGHLSLHLFNFNFFNLIEAGVT